MSNNSGWHIYIYASRKLWKEILNLLYSRLHSTSYNVNSISYFQQFGYWRHILLLVFILSIVRRFIFEENSVITLIAGKHCIPLFIFHTPFNCDFHECFFTFYLISCYLIDALIKFQDNAPDSIESYTHRIWGLFWYTNDILYY